MFLNAYNLIVFVKPMYLNYCNSSQFIRYLSHKISGYFIFAELATILSFKEADYLLSFY